MGAYAAQVDLCRRDARVPEGVPHDVERRARADHVNCECVAEAVRVRAALDPGLAREPRDHVPDVRLVLSLSVWDTRAGPRVGDFVEFADGRTRRVSFLTPDEWLPEIDSVQTSDGGSFYLSGSYVSFSGSLYQGVPRSALVPTDERRPGDCWIFHHDQWGAGNGVPVVVPWRVFTCEREAPL